MKRDYICMDTNQTCCCKPTSAQQPLLTISLIGLAVSALSFVLAILTFFTNLWRLYADNEWKKAYNEVELAKEFTSAEEAEGKIVAVKEKVHELNLKCIKGASISADLDYADLYFIYQSRGVKQHHLKEQHPTLAPKLEKWTKEMEKNRLKAYLVARIRPDSLSGCIAYKLVVQVKQATFDLHLVQAAAFWDKAAGMHMSHQLLPIYSPFWGTMRICLGLPSNGFLGPKWKGRGSRHQKLVEPLDIANWYSIKPPEIKTYSDATQVRPPRYLLFSEGQSADENNGPGEEMSTWEKYQSVRTKYAPEPGAEDDKIVNQVSIAHALYPNNMIASQCFVSATT